ncbi:50S ribosomal protein L11 methyltransferase [Thermosediminibacter oceani]|uniref:Ribosomal protein L11 methyltransferase n=1 Tax=Thermosediminibacter oceani (strain ATCC BAA-1034 / DSM 16646 / JW/IW-1228P) TaxID=555079 RepID=D9S2P6_THEOJ|nr:50S ribosomal protein L11 methyltransferase [Thermosediminibacter oceani]ADL07673.1 (LSU ribosomal protein L11P)-lysine N-methyltransferase [Thermosediminibacter oceani DSM 16646]
MKWIEIKVKTSTEAIEAVANILYEAGAAGVVIEDPKDLLNRDKDAWEYVEIPEDIDFEQAMVTGYLPESEGLNDILRVIERRIAELPRFGLDVGSGKVEVSSVDESDWANAWKAYYKTIHIGKRLVIRPSWIHYEPEKGEVVVELDPGMAFGTGTHETTAMCLELLEKYIEGGETVIDVGCGSGILSIAAAKLGAGKVLAIDKDEVAVKVARENIKRNDTTQAVEVIKGEGLDCVDAKADIIVANIIADVIIDLAGVAASKLKQEGLFISSGIIKSRKESVCQALDRAGLVVIEEAEKGDWVALVSRKTLSGDG